MENTDFILTKAALLKKKSAEEYKEVKFEAYKPKGSLKESGKKEIEQFKQKTEEFDLKKTKHEIIQFGMAGFDSSKKEEVKMQLAIKLGAKPPKNKYKNYKLLMQEKKREKEKEEKLKTFQQMGKNNLGKSTAKGKSFDRKRRKKDGLLDVYGKVKKQNVK